MNNKTETFAIELEPTPELMNFLNNLKSQIHCCAVVNEIPCTNPAPYIKLDKNVFVCKSCFDEHISKYYN